MSRSCAERMSDYNTDRLEHSLLHIELVASGNPAAVIKPWMFILIMFCEF